MRLEPLPYNEERDHVLRLLEQDARARWSILWVERMHLGLLGTLCFLTLLCLYNGQGTLGVAVAASLALLCLIGLLVSKWTRLLLQDLYRQFHYREKFALFLVHACILVVPYFAFGVRDWPILFSLLLAVLCFQAIDHLFVSRILALCGAIVLWMCAMPSGGPGLLLVAAWTLAFLLSIRFGHLRFRLEQYGQGEELDPRDVLRRTVLPCVVPVVAGAGAALLASLWMRPRALRFDPGATQRQGDGVFVSYSQMLWDAFFLIVGVIAILVLLNWLDKKLRRRKGVPVPEEAGIGSTVSMHGRGEEGEDDLAAAETSGPRRRILNAFRQLSRELQNFGLARADAETAEDYLQRITRAAASVAPVADAEATKPFNVACYSEIEPAELEAEEFELTVDEIVRAMRAGTAPPADGKS